MRIAAKSRANFASGCDGSGQPPPFLISRGNCAPSLTLRYIRLARKYNLKMRSFLLAMYATGILSSEIFHDATSEILQELRFRKT